MEGADMKKAIPDSRRLLFAGMFTATILQPSTALAHLVTTGMGPVYDGIGHLLLTPEDLVPAVAVALYAGLRGRAPGRRALFFLPLAWLVGGLAGLTATGFMSFPLPALSFILLGILIAADLRLPTNIFTGLVVVVGLVHGFFNGIALKGGPAALGLVGIMVALFVLVALASAFVLSLKPLWARIVIRVAGSWVTAMGILMLGWFVRGQS
jgi:hydrogenase/urease accessory protein HupE